MPTVLVIDDDPKFLSAMDQMLSTAGYRVLVALDGTDASALLEKKHTEIDLTIVDLALPDINGFELIGAISRRSNPIKVIATTGAYKDSHLEMAGTLGAHAALRKPAHGKPIPEREWLDTVKRLVGNAAHVERASAARMPGVTKIPKTELPNDRKTDE